MEYKIKKDRNTRSYVIFGTFNSLLIIGTYIKKIKFFFFLIV
jgi:hypothetical protein